MTSEELLGFTIPPEHQCPAIDDYIGAAVKCSLDLHYAARSGDLGELTETCDVVSTYVNYLAEDFEDLRVTLEQLRVWGQDWKRLAKELIVEYEPELLEEPKEETV